MVLEHPGMRNVVEIRVFVEQREFIESLQAYLVVGSLEITLADIGLPPRPLVWQFILPLHRKQKMLNFKFKFPKRSSVLNMVLARSSIEYLQEAESVENCMVPAQIG